MKLFILRLLIIGILFLLFTFVTKTAEAPLLLAFVGCYIIEPLIISKT